MPPGQIPAPRSTAPEAHPAVAASRRVAREPTAAVRPLVLEATRAAVHDAVHPQPPLRPPRPTARRATGPGSTRAWADRRAAAPSERRHIDCSGRAAGLVDHAPTRDGQLPATTPGGLHPNGPGLPAGSSAAPHSSDGRSAPAPATAAATRTDQPSLTRTTMSTCRASSAIMAVKATASSAPRLR